MLSRTRMREGGGSSASAARSTSCCLARACVRVVTVRRVHDTGHPCCLARACVRVASHPATPHTSVSCCLARACVRVVPGNPSDATSGGGNLSTHHASFTSLNTERISSRVAPSTVFSGYFFGGIWHNVSEKISKGTSLAWHHSAPASLTAFSILFPFSSTGFSCLVID